MAACLRSPALRGPALSRALRHTKRTVSCMAGLEYPAPTVFQALGPHQSTLIMLHGLGKLTLYI